MSPRDVKILTGDCLEQMRALPAGSIDCIVTDPPYGLEFMGKEWDGLGSGPRQQEWHRQWALEAFRVLKPGGHLLAFGGSRTYHRLACAVEDAGFEIRDQLQWLYGSGFPKSANTERAIARATYDGPPLGEDDELPMTPESEPWAGWGTALKPAHEPIVMARKPLDERNVAANVLKHGTGAINVDACRIAGAKGDGNWAGKTAARGYEGGWDSEAKPNTEQNEQGRWPANVLLDPEAATLLDEQAPKTGAQAKVKGSEPSATTGEVYGAYAQRAGNDRLDGLAGASRFFYVAKPSKRERNAGMDEFPEKPSAKMGAGLRSSVGREVEGTTDARDRRQRNHHPTVKPITLMKFLVRLVCPPGGTVLDPFLGSGTTGCAAVQEPCVGGFIGIEREPEYVEIARARINHWAQQAELSQPAA